MGAWKILMIFIIELIINGLVLIINGSITGSVNDELKNETIDGIRREGDIIIANGIILTLTTLGYTYKIFPILSKIIMFVDAGVFILWATYKTIISIFGIFFIAKETVQEFGICIYIKILLTYIITAIFATAQGLIYFFILRKVLF